MPRPIDASRTVRLWPVPSARWTLLRALVSPVSLLGLATIAFHGWLFGRRLVEGTLFESGVLARWAAALLLAAGVCVLQRRGLAVWRGRRAIVFWLSVVLLHAGIQAPVTPVGEALQLAPLSATLDGASWLLPLVLALELLHRLSAGQDRPCRSRLSRARHRRATPPARCLAAWPPRFRRPPPLVAAFA
ncbi:MAG: hypothetical protein AAGN46_13985 [Acidobacteriota bacterium]